MMNEHNHVVFDFLRGKVSMAALNLLVREMSRIQHLLNSNRPCGCNLYTACGLPCACQLIKYLHSGDYIIYNVCYLFLFLIKMLKFIIQGKKYH